MARPPHDIVFYLPTVAPLLSPGTAVPPGGAETQIFLIARLLARRGHSVALVAYQLPSGLPSSIDGVDVVPRPMYMPHSPLTGKIKEIFRIWKALHRANGSVVVKRAYGIDAGLVAGFCRLTRRRFVYSSASVVDFAAEQLLTKRRDLKLFEAGVRGAHEVVVQTDEQVPLCEERFSRTPTLIKSVVEPVADEPPPADPQCFLWIGRLVDYKRPLAYVALARSLPHCSFKMVGVPSLDRPKGHELFAEVKSAAQELPNLELLPPRPRAELGPLLSEAVAVVNTADWEGMPNIFLEGWVRGVPALALTHDPGGVIKRHGIGAFAGGSAEVLQALADDLWRGRFDRAKLSSRCRQYAAAEHGSDAVIDRWESVLGLVQSTARGTNAEMIGQSACAG